MVKLLSVASVSDDDYAADEAAAAAAGVDLRKLRRAEVLTYDTARYPFREAVLACLGLSGGGSCEEEGAALEALRASATSSDRKGPGGRGPSTPYIQQWQMGVRGPDGAKFEAVYLRFLREVVLPHLGDPRGIVFQRHPTFRCHVAGGGVPTGQVHNDSQYGHSRKELNFWLPVTRARESNSLYAESRPGAADFAPFELGYGECQRFWGAQCVHYALANETDLTRVSVDFRVVPRSCHVDDDGATRGFCLGGFFAALDGEGVLSFGGVESMAGVS